MDNKPAINPMRTIFDSLNSTLVNSTLTAKIDANSTSSNTPATIEFGANSTGGLTPYSFVWNFGDGNNGTNTSEKVSHTFDKPGDYNITLSVKDSSTPSQNATANMLVTITSPANKTELESLTANIDANSTSSNAPATIEFGANSTGGLTPYSFVWNFGDGNNGTNTSEKVSHTFDKPGDYNITLSAKDSSTPSQNATANMLVTITSHANGTSIDTNGTSIDTNGTSIDTNGTSIDTNGTSIDTNGTSIDTNGTSIDTNDTIAITNSTDSGDSGGSVTPETMAITNSTDSGDSGGSVTPETMAITNSTDSGDSGGSVTPETMAITNSTDSGDSGGSVTPETTKYEANSISASKSLGRNIDQHITTISKNMSLRKNI